MLDSTFGTESIASLLMSLSGKGLISVVKETSSCRVTGVTVESEKNSVVSVLVGINDKDKVMSVRAQSIVQKVTNFKIMVELIRRARSNMCVSSNLVKIQLRN